MMSDLAPSIELGWVGRLFLFGLVVGVPIIAVLQPIDRRIPLPPRRDLYLSGVVGTLALGALVWLALWIEGVPLAAVGLVEVDALRFLAWTGATALGALAGNFAITRAAAAFGVEESRLTYHLMPRDSGERRLFLALSAAAGLGEEFTYHGFAVAGLAAWTGSGWWAAVIANLAFGVLHGYQGQVGMARAALMGMVLTLPVILGAGLWPSIAAHFLVDALLGLWLWKWMIPGKRVRAES